MKDKDLHDEVNTAMDADEASIYTPDVFNESYGVTPLISII